MLFRSEVIVANSTPPALAAKSATNTIPIVFFANNPVESGLVWSLALPGANLTGLSTVNTDFAGKRVEILKDLFPAARHAAVLWNRLNNGSTLAFQGMELASGRIGLELKDFGISSRRELNGAITSAVQAGAAAVLAIDDPVIQSYQDEIVALATKSALPILSQYPEFARGGGLLSYGPNLAAIYRRGAVYVDRILKGAKPSDMPIEQPTQFNLVINMRTAKTLGINVPGIVFARADEVIE